MVPAPVMPTAAAAELVAEEFSAQEHHIDPASMPVMRLVNTAIDGVATDMQAVVEDKTNVRLVPEVRIVGVTA